jgi:hypothetical protein
VLPTTPSAALYITKPYVVFRCAAASEFAQISALVHLESSSRK